MVRRSLFLCDLVAIAKIILFCQSRMERDDEIGMVTMVQPRKPKATVQCIDTYCKLYQDLFTEVRSYESFKYIHWGLLSDIKRKTLPAIAKIVGLRNEQCLHHFLSESPWQVDQLEQRRLQIIKNLRVSRE